MCLNILRENWTPSIDLTQVACSLQFLLAEPNPEDPLNEGLLSPPSSLLEAAALYKRDINVFVERVQNKQQ